MSFPVIDILKRISNKKSPHVDSIMKPKIGCWVSVIVLLYSYSYNHTLCKIQQQLNSKEIAELSPSCSEVPDQSISLLNNEQGDLILI